MDTPETTQARERVNAAKDLFTKTAIGILKDDEHAIALADAVLRELTTAQHELRRLNEGGQQWRLTLRWIPGGYLQLQRFA